MRVYNALCDLVYGYTRKLDTDPRAVARALRKKAKELDE